MCPCSSLIVVFTPLALLNRKTSAFIDLWGFDCWCQNDGTWFGPRGGTPPYGLNGDVQPRPQGLLAFQYGGGSGEDPGTQQNHVTKISNEDGNVLKMAAKAK